MKTATIEQPRTQKDPKWINAGIKAAQTRKLRELGENNVAVTQKEVIEEKTEVHASSVFNLQATINYNINKLQIGKVDRPWVEKYRPTTLNECLGSVVKYFKAFVKTGSLPLSFILYGIYGRGKTTVGKCFIRDFYVARGLFKKDATFNQIISAANTTKNYDGIFPPALYLNASSFTHKGNGLILNEVVSRVQNFMKYNVGKENIKFIIIDEADLFGFEVQDSISSWMEKHERTRIIWITNYVNQIRDRIVSRAAGGLFEFKKPTEQELMKHLQMICQKEKIKMPKNTLREIVETAPGVRDAIGMLQREAVVIKASKK